MAVLSWSVNNVYLLSTLSLPTCNQHQSRRYWYLTLVNSSFHPSGIGKNEDEQLRHQLWLGRQRQVWFIPFVDKRVDGRQTYVIPLQCVPCLSAMIPREEVLNQLSLTFTFKVVKCMINCSLFSLVLCGFG